MLNNTVFPNVRLGRGILRAILVNVTSGALRQGGSTITQQLIKQAFLGDQRTFIRKFKEAVLAISLDAHLDKEEIQALKNLEKQTIPVLPHDARRSLTEKLLYYFKLHLFPEKEIKSFKVLVDILE